VTRAAIAGSRFAAVAALVALLGATPAPVPSPATVQAGCDDQATRLATYRELLAGTVKVLDEAGAIADGTTPPHGDAGRALGDAYESAAVSADVVADDAARDPDDRVAAVYAVALHYARAYAALLASFGESLDRSGPVDVETMVAYGEMLPKPDDATVPWIRLSREKAKQLIGERRIALRGLPEPAARAAEAMLAFCRNGVTQRKRRPCVAFENAVAPAAASLATGLAVLRRLKRGSDADVPAEQRAALTRDRDAADAAAAAARDVVARVQPGLCADPKLAADRLRHLQALADGIRLLTKAMRSQSAGWQASSPARPSSSVLGNVAGIVQTGAAIRLARQAGTIATEMPWLRNAVDDEARLAGVAAATLPPA
jgi:hypothetical protein